MSEWDHTVFLSDGTQLSRAEWKRLNETGQLAKGGRTLTINEDRAHREIMYATDLMNKFIGRAFK